MVGGWAMPVKHTYDAATSKSSKYSETVPRTVIFRDCIGYSECTRLLCQAPHMLLLCAGGFKIFRATRFLYSATHNVGPTWCTGGPSDGTLFFFLVSKIYVGASVSQLALKKGGTCSNFKSLFSSHGGRPSFNSLGFQINSQR